MAQRSGGENKNLVKQGGGGAENGQVIAEKCTFLIWQGQEKCDQMVMGYEACFFALWKIKRYNKGKLDAKRFTG